MDEAIASSSKEVVRVKEVYLIRVLNHPAKWPTHTATALPFIVSFLHPASTPT